MSSVWLFKVGLQGNFGSQGVAPGEYDKKDMHIEGCEWAIGCSEGALGLRH